MNGEVIDFTYTISITLTEVNVTAEPNTAIHKGPIKLLIFWITSLTSEYAPNIYKIEAIKNSFHI